eukprot:711725_1
MTEFVDKYRDSTQEFQCFFDIVGSEFMTVFYDDVPHRVALLSPPYLEPDDLKFMMADLRTRLVDHVKRRSVECGLMASKMVVKYREDVRDMVLEAVDHQTALLGLSEPDVLSASLVELLKNNESQNRKLYQFGGHLLSQILRRYVWGLTLKDKSFSTQCEEQISENLDRGGIDLLSEKNLDSPIANLIERIFRNSMSDFINFTPAGSGMEPMYSDNPSFSLNVRKVLNLYFMFCESYSARLSTIAAHLVNSFMSESHFVLMPMFSKLVGECIPDEDRSKSIGDSIIERLQASDPSLSSHLSECFGNVLANIDDAQRGVCGLTVPVKPAHLAARWMQYAFVGFLNPVSTNFVWDQCFLFGWSLLTDIAFEVLQLLKPAIMNVTQLAELDRVCVIESRKLTVENLQLALREYVTTE